METTAAAMETTRRIQHQQQEHTNTRGNGDLKRNNTIETLSGNGYSMMETISATERQHQEQQQRQHHQLRGRQHQQQRRRQNHQRRRH
ncbi:hypothetical protein ACOMHN_030945 [Nucella lapillus]